MDPRLTFTVAEARSATAAPTAVEIRGHLMADLDEEIEVTRRLYVSPAITGIATLRAELFGAQHG
jgi:hypothetical protein